MTRSADLMGLVKLFENLRTLDESRSLGLGPLG